MPKTIERLGTAGQREDWKTPDDVFLSSSQTRDQYDAWLQAPAKKLTFSRMGRTYQADPSGIFVVPVSIGEDRELSAELIQWQDAAVDAYWSFESRSEEK